MSEITITMNRDDWDTLCALLYIASIETDCNQRTKRAMENFRVRINAALEQPTQ